MRTKEIVSNNTTIILSEDQTYYPGSSVIVGEYPKFVDGKICRDKAEEDAHIGKKAAKIKKTDVED